MKFCETVGDELPQNGCKQTLDTYTYTPVN